MRHNQLQVGALLVIVAMAAAGCASPPEQELDAAKAALANAQQAEAQTYAPEAWDRAQQAMNTVNAELEAQNAKFALFRSYTNAKQLIADATNAANEAQQAGVVARERTRTESQALLEEIKEIAETAQGYLRDLRRCRRALAVKGFRQDLELMSGNLDGYLAQIEELERQFDSGDFAGVNAQGAVLQNDLSRMASELLEVKTRFRC